LSDSELVTLKNPVTENDHSVGPSDAPVTLLEYGNFGCVDCGIVYPQLKEVRKLLGNDLRFVYRHFPSVRTHPQAMRAAEAAESAGAQGRFWQMHDELFTHQNALDDHHLVRYAGRIGIKVEQFESDLAEGVFQKQIEEEYQRSLFDEHITGTPTFYLNSTRYDGAVSTESLLQAIKDADIADRIKLPAKTHGLASLLERLRHRAKSA
jgi:protein-disulfide isomerase